MVARTGGQLSQREGTLKAGDVLHSDSADRAIIFSMKILLIAVFVPLLASCASSGLYNMSDTWCAAHPSASLARCPIKDDRVAANDSEHLANSEVATNH